jgi:phosphatidylinositol 3,5-bisphosphate 5-phosphatase
MSLKSGRKKDQYPWDEKFVWNFYLIEDLLKIVKNKKWILPVVHGYISMLSKYKNLMFSIDLEYHAKKLSFILIGRRSRHYAGVRYPRRGIDREGNVANFVETE